MPLVSIIMGSESDTSFMQSTADILAEMGIEHEVLVMSAHRNAEVVREFCKTVRDRGVEVIIAGAGGAAHLPGVLASWTTLPVIGVPLPTSDLAGVDALYAIVQMPAGVPVATVAIGKPGAKNAAYLAAQILGVKYAPIRQAYEEHRRRLAQSEKQA